ncbi:uncharacterized protein MKZ38_009439 [Zalerion maritima]|uniref:Uncharacterized protein n=1 Tax=Zalerion maritima TaxID=339359 RepID=A0AAD5RGU6_9PEZI|nr:uncharacterized protein MKZ38_009439 [Zalerion maritima]
MDRGDTPSQKPRASLPKSRFSLGATNGAGRFVNRKATRNLFTGADMNTTNNTKADPLPLPRPQSPAHSGRIPRSVRTVRSVSGLSTASAGSNGLGEPAERSGIPRLSRTPSRPEMYERPPSVASSTGSVRSESRIPRPSLAHSNLPKTQTKRPMTMFEAWKMTEEVEELGRTSPSPAPRLGGLRRAQDEIRMQKVKSQSPLDFSKRTNGTRTTSDSIRDDTSITSTVGHSAIPRPVRHDEEGEDDLDRKIRQFEWDQQKKNGLPRRESSLFTRNNVGERVAEAGKELVKKASNSSLKENSPARPRTWGSKGRVSNEWMKRAIASPEKEKEPLQERNHNPTSGATGKGKGVESPDIPLPSVEVHPPAATHEIEPESVKGEFNWQLDADFTEGDLQISDSPRVSFPRNQAPQRTDSPSRLRNSNTPDSDQQSDTETEASFLAKSERGTDDSPRRTNTRLDEIRQLEQAAEEKISQRLERGNRSRTNSRTKLDEVRDREAESLSRKSIAAVRLGEIRERNSLSPSTSPRVSKKKNSTPGAAAVPMQEPTPDPTEGRRSKSLPQEEERQGGAPTEDTPVTVYRSTKRKPENDDKTKGDGAAAVQQPQPRPYHRREDSRDILRRLARVSSNSPQPEVAGGGDNEKSIADKNGSLSSSSTRPTSDIIRSSLDTAKAPPPSCLTNPNKTDDNESKCPSTNPKSSVGFVGLGLSRSSSADSAPSSKRSSRSDIDPTDRIEAEMNLFAPQDNYSEKGSVRAPSPKNRPSNSDNEQEKDSEEEEFETGLEEATPRATKSDPLTQPTPKAPGAYVDTPATVRVAEPQLKFERKGRGKESDIIEDEVEAESDPEPIVAAASSQEEEQFKKPSTCTSRRRLAHHGKHNSTTGITPQSSPQKHQSDRTTSSTTSNAATNKQKIIQTSAGPISVRRRRVRSEPRRPRNNSGLPLVNTARIPSVRDDLLEIQRAANIEDSTLDEFDQLIREHENSATTSTSSHRKPRKEGQDKGEAEDGWTTEGAEVEEDELDKIEKMSPEAADKMQRRLDMALGEIRSARAWANRFEEELNGRERERTGDGKTTNGHPRASSSASSDGAAKPPQPKTRQGQTKAKAAGQGQTRSSSWYDLYIPTQGFTTLFWTLIFILTYILAEFNLCLYTCKPSTCGPSISCEWSANDPSGIGRAIPVKLDQWVTGGWAGRKLGEWGEEVGDWGVDVYCEYFAGSPLRLANGDGDETPDPQDGSGGVNVLREALGLSGCAFTGKDKRRVERILEKKRLREEAQRSKGDKKTKGLRERREREEDKINPAMVEWLEMKRREEAEMLAARAAGTEDGYEYGEMGGRPDGYEEDGEEEGNDDVGFISGDEVV